MTNRQKNKQVPELIPNFKKKMDEIDDLIEISPELDQKMLKLISNTATKKQALRFNDYWLCLANKIATKARSIILPFRINNFSYNPFILIATLIIIVISLGSYYLVYRKNTIGISKNPQPQSTHTNIIANKETPAIKLNPSSTPTPVVTPSPVETISPNIAKSPEKNINNENTAKYQQNRNKRNTQIQPNKSIPENNSIDSKDNEQEETAIIQIQPNKSIPENNSIDNKDNQQDDITTVTRGNNAALATMKNIYISNFIEKDLRNALKEVLKANGFNVFENLANANTSIDGQLEYSLPEANSVILSINNKSVFEKFLSRFSAKEEAQVIVSNLIEAIEKAKEAIEKSKTEQKQK